MPMPILGRVIKRAINLRKKIKFQPGEPIQYQSRVLKKLLRAAKDTEFGMQYDFEGILKSPTIIRTFQDLVPTFNYNHIFNEWWKRAMHGEENIFWPGKVKYFALSSGTSEASSKYIPVTKEMLKSITKASVKQFYSLANFNLSPELFQKGVFTLGSSTNLIRQGDYFIGDMSGISANQSIPFWVNRFIKPGKEIMSVHDWDTKLDEITKHAKEWDIGVLCGIPAWVQIMVERILEFHKAEHIHEIWPNLGVYIHGGISFDPYRKNFNKFFGNGVTYIETYMASEGFFGFRANPGESGMHLILNNGIFYEFAPFNKDYFDDDGNLLQGSKLLQINEVKKGTDYALFISTNAGAWRYLIGDTIKFLNTRSKEFIITGRTKHFLNICGEHLSIDNMNRAIQMTSDKLHISIPEFTVAGIPYENLFAHKWYLGTESNIEQNIIGRELDQNLRTVNDDYDTERDNVLKGIQIETVPVNRFYEFLKLTSKIGDQSKFPRVMKKDQFHKWESFVQSRH